ncbi:helix-turn-helix transcriptional regulator [Streptomyces sp. IBSBF 2435]|uniref:helix-turn-helix transcriptional regulator n=1 Tax=Streptomyces sp. IBSBF 2435 TaxID=2903531 RepID=UPI002FDC4BA1
MTARRALTPAEVLALPAMADLVPDAVDALGVSRDTGYSLVRTGEFPVPVVPVGRRLKVRRADLIAFLRITEDPDAQ